MRASGLLALFAFVLGTDLSLAAGHNKILWPKPIEISQGELAEISVVGADITAVEGTLGKEKIVFHTNGTT